MMGFFFVSFGMKMMIPLGFQCVPCYSQASSSSSSFEGWGATLVKPFGEGLLGNQVAFLFQGKKARGGASNGQPNQSLAGHQNWLATMIFPGQGLLSLGERFSFHKHFSIKCSCPQRFPSNIDYFSLSHPSIPSSTFNTFSSQSMHNLFKANDVPSHKGELMIYHHGLRHICYMKLHLFHCHQGPSMRIQFPLFSSQINQQGCLAHYGLAFTFTTFHTGVLFYGPKVLPKLDIRETWVKVRFYLVMDLAKAYRMDIFSMHNKNPSCKLNYYSKEGILWPSLLESATMVRFQHCCCFLNHAFNFNGFSCFLLGIFFK